tara:strand:- start:635 stop:1132 length:498 start_codon:yes stop_codon:yes gene_type:complete
MAEKDKVVTQKIKRVGVFNFKETYNFMYKWLSEEDYAIEEQKYVEEVAGDAKKIEIIWVASKKVSDYFRNDIKLTWTILNMKNVEVEKDGKRVKMNDASFEVKFAGTLVKDYQSTWEKNPMTKFFRGVYDKFIIEGRIERYEDKLFGDVDDLIKDVKGFLAIEGK